MEETKLILLADDHPALRRGLSDMVREAPSKYKYAVHLAENAEQAIEMAKANKYALILMDFYMPGMEGDEAIKEIIKHNPEAKILGISGDNDMDIIHKMLKAGAKGFISKVINHEELACCVEAVIDGAEECYSRDARFVVNSYNEALKRHLIIEETQTYLTPREIEVAKRKINFDSNKKIADDMHISKRTVETHVNDIGHKFNTIDDRYLLLKLAKEYLIKMHLLKK